MSKKIEKIDIFRRHVDSIDSFAARCRFSSLSSTWRGDVSIRSTRPTVVSIIPGFFDRFAVYVDRIDKTVSPSRFGEGLAESRYGGRGRKRLVSGLEF